MSNEPNVPTAGWADYHELYRVDSTIVKYGGFVLVRMESGNTIGDMLDMDFEDEMSELGFDFDEEDYDQWTQKDRSIIFDILWDYFDEFPEERIEDSALLSSLCDGNDHTYEIRFGDDIRQTQVPGLALFGFMDDGASVSLIDE